MMRITVAVLALFWWLSPAPAQHNHAAAPSQPGCAWVQPCPPLWAINPEYPSTRPVEVVPDVPDWLMPVLCELPPGALWGCAVESETKWTVFMRAGLPNEVHQDVLAHEMAHTRGWKHD